MQLGPDHCAFIDADLEIVVACAERSELLDRTLLLGRCEGLASPAPGMMVSKPLLGRSRASTMPVPDSGGNAPLDLAEHWVHVVWELAGVEVGLHGDDAAPDVDPHGGGDDRIPGRDHRADRGADPQVRVRHE